MQQRIEHEFDAYDNEVLDGLSAGLYRFANMIGIVGLALVGLGRRRHGDWTLSFTTGRPGHHRVRGGGHGGRVLVPLADGRALSHHP